MRNIDKTKLAIEGNRDEGEPGVVEAWIDEQGLPRRVRIPFGGETESGFVVDLFDFGAPVDVEAPPADEVVSEDEFERLMDKVCADADKAPEKMNPLCAIFGATLTESSSSGSGEYSPTETIPRKVTDSK